MMKDSGRSVLHSSVKSEFSVFHAIMTRLEAALTCDLIATRFDLTSDVLCLDAEDALILARATSRGSGFSRIPIATSPGRSPTHVAFVDLSTRTVQERRQLHAVDLVASKTPIMDLIGLLAERRYYFVLYGPEVGGIVTVSDLNKLPVRTYLFTILSHLEGVLADLIQETYPDDTWLSLLSPSRQSTIGDLHDLKVRQDFDTTLIDCTTITDKLTVVEKDSRLRARFKKSAREFRGYVAPIRDLRNRLGHGLLPISEPGQVDIMRDDVMHQQKLTTSDPRWCASVNHAILAMIDLGVRSEERDEVRTTAGDPEEPTSRGR